MRRAFLASALVSLCACSNPEKERLRATTRPTYDKQTGKLTELTYDANKNGRIDTWTDMDGRRPLRSRIDLNEDGKVDRWEYYDDRGQLLKVGFSRKDNGKVDAWAFSGPDGKLQRIEISSSGAEEKVDRWEYYDASRSTGSDDAGTLVRAEEDTNEDGRPDKWETYEDGAVRTAAFDEDGDGTPDRRLQYDGAVLVLIESAPDASGRYTRRLELK